MLKPIPELLSEIKHHVRCIDAKTSVQEMSENDGLLVDVREPAEYQTNGVPKAVNLPRGLLEMKMLELEKDPARAIYLHCASSARAILGAEQLQRIGYENVTVITCNMTVINEECK